MSIKTALTPFCSTERFAADLSRACKPILKALWSKCGALLAFYGVAAVL